MIGRRLGVVLAGACLALAAGHARAAELAYVLYRGATLIDGATGARQANMAILVHGERIERIDPAAALSPPPGARVVDVSGLYAAPGLIDSHVHLATPPKPEFARAMLQKELYGGVTAVRDMADDLRLVAELSREARFGEIPGPDIYFAALMAGPEFFKDPRVAAVSRGLETGHAPWMQAITPATDLPLAVALARGTGATAIKIYADLEAPEVVAIVKEAHRQHERVWAHAAVFPASPKAVIEAGADVVSHVCMLAYQVSDPIPRAYHDRAPVPEARFANGVDPAVEALFAEMKRRGTILDATLRVYKALGAAHAAHPDGPPPYCSEGLAERLTAAAVRAGVPVSAGTDGFSPDADPWPSLQDELELLQDKAGMTPLEVIRSATLIGAMTLGQEGEMGTIAPGKLADLVFTRDDPSKNVRAFRTVVLTVKRGAPFWRRDYHPAATPTQAKESGE